MFENDCGRYPTEQEGLTALFGNPGVDGWTGPYVKGRKENVLLDGWGTPFRYTCPAGTDCRVISAGPDKEFGTEDDVADMAKVMIAEDGSLSVAGQPVSQEQLGARLTSSGVRKTDPIVLEADQNVEYEIVTKTMTSLKAAGFTRVHLVTGRAGTDY